MSVKDSSKALSLDTVKYSKEDDNVDISVTKLDSSDIIESQAEINAADPLDARLRNSLNCSNLIEPKIENKLKIEPRHVRDFEIIKPNEKEPSIFRALTSMLKRGGGNKSKQPETVQFNSQQKITSFNSFSNDNNEQEEKTATK